GGNKRHLGTNFNGVTLSGPRDYRYSDFHVLVINPFTLLVRGAIAIQGIKNKPFYVMLGTIRV
ncbi:hypothetical protein EFP24_17025, partial [Lactiplantibacillus pentosus]